MARFSRLTLRDLFWLILLVAIAVGWYLERQRAREQLAKYAASNPTWLRGPVTGPGSNPAAEIRAKYLRDFRARTPDELTKIFDQLPPATAYHTSDEYQCCLDEMARRGMAAELQARYEQAQKSTNPEGGGPANAHLLTALRRAQGKPDPVQVKVEVVNLPGAPTGLLPTLVNVDSKPISLTRGGDYRSGRQSRFRVQLTDQRGARVPDSNWPQFGMGGGISSFGPFQPGETIDNQTPLDPRCYVKSPPSGRYQLQVVYAEQEIAADSDLTGLIVWQSTPVAVQVTNRTLAGEQRFYPWPILGAFFVLASGYGVAAFRRRSGASPAAPARWWNGRDVVALTLFVALAAGWIVELRRLELAIDNVRPDREAIWSMEVVPQSPVLR